MKKINIPKITWVSSIFIFLIIILLSVMNYKINYEYLSKNYLYFYECENSLCVSQVKEDNLIYSKYDCGYEECPEYSRQIEDSNYVILIKDNKHLLYNYRTSKLISDKYENYEILNNNYIIVKSNNKKGIINFKNEILIGVIYDEIGYKKNEYLSGYNLNNILVKKDGLYGIISYKTGEIVEEIKYKEDEINMLLDKLKNN